ncbi:MAG: hypothetical protein P4L50_03180 [Anaerolineaceae bacterium]|nr:hypothetical protein [Anaerolineaceae bacterium]
MITTLLAGIFGIIIVVGLVAGFLTLAGFVKSSPTTSYHPPKIKSGDCVDACSGGASRVTWRGYEEPAKFTRSRQVPDVLKRLAEEGDPVEIEPISVPNWPVKVKKQ